jgi:hypothetical protein
MLARIARVGGLAALIVSLESGAWAQGRAELNGTVFDQGKAVLPGATVTAINADTGIAQETVTGPDGRFVFATLLPGTYNIRVELTSFQTLVREGVLVGVGQELTLDFTLQLSTITEAVTVTGQSPVVEVTASRVGTNMTSQEIDTLPSQGRNQLSLMQLVPGLTPTLQPGEFEGGQYNANGRETGSNVFLLDGLNNHSPRNGGGFGGQARVTLDSMAEYQVLTHQYGAEYGGASGVVVNAVSRSGTNNLAGRAFFYFQDESLNAVEHFAKLSGQENPQSGQRIWGFNVGGPIVRNKAFFFFNFEQQRINDGVTLVFPQNAAPLAVGFSDTFRIKALNLFARGDYQPSPNHNLSGKFVRQSTFEHGSEWEETLSLHDNIGLEDDARDQLANVTWMWLIGGRAANELRIGDVQQSAFSGGVPYFDGDDYIGLNGRDQFDIGSANIHPDYAAGPRPIHGIAKERTNMIENSLTITKSGWGGTHTFKTGASYVRPRVAPAISGANDIGTFTFLQNQPFDPANPFTYPSRFAIRLGQIHFNINDSVVNSYVSDKWQLTRNVTLNLGVRYDYQNLVPKTKNAFAPRVGVAWDPTGTGKTAIRAGFGKFYETQVITTGTTLAQAAVISPAFVSDTGEDRSALSGRMPAHVCLQPTGRGGLAFISPACRAFLNDVRNRVAAGGFVNSEPTVDGDRRLGYLLGFSVGVEREIMPNLGVSVDFVGNRGRDQTALIDINEPRRRADGTIGRPGVNVFDAAGTLIPAQARGTTFQRVLQFQTLDALNTKYNALEMSLEKRYSNRWSGRFSYTLAESKLVGTTGGRASLVSKRVADDLDPRSDYGRANFDNRHAIAGSVNVNPWRGLGAGAVFRYYSGYPINETVGSDANGDRDNFDRPVRGIDDLTRPIMSELDSNGRAIRNGIQGESMMLLDLRLQYNLNLVGRQTSSFFWEIYNATNRVNFVNPTGNRRSANFLVPVATHGARTMQLGFRYTF